LPSRHRPTQFVVRRCRPMRSLYRKSITEAKVPTQWKTAHITPVPKVPHPTEPSDFRPISIIPVMARMLEKLIVKYIFYPIYFIPDVAQLLSDQFAFRPSGSTTAALSHILNDLSQLCATDTYVHIIALDFSKAFDTVRHSTLTDKLASLPLADSIYNWLVDNLSSRLHCTKVGGLLSSPLPINASVVQGSPLGPTNFLITASDLKCIVPGNKLYKYADDTYLIIPAKNSYSIQTELHAIEQWAKLNNLCLNYQKSSEMIVYRKIRAETFTLPKSVTGLKRVDTLKILGVTIDCHLSVQKHVDNLVQISGQNLYALKTLKFHGMSSDILSSVCTVTLINRLLYASSAWRGFATLSDLNRLQAVLNRAMRWGVLSTTTPCLSDLFDSVDDKLFSKVLSNTNHVMHHLLPPKKEVTYHLRPRAHDRVISIKTTLSSHNFIHRMLSKDSY